MHVDHNMHVIGCNMHVTCTLFRIGLTLELAFAIGNKSTTIVFRDQTISRIIADLKIM